MEEWTRSTISARLHKEMCEHDENLEPFSEQKKYYIQAIKYANRRTIVKKPSDFHDVFHLYLLTFSPELRDHILRLDEDGLNEVISEPVKRIIKSRNPEIYREYLQFEPLSWDLINGDGNGNGDGLLIAEHVTIADTPPEESVTITQRLARQIMRQYTFATTTKDEELFYYDIEKGIYCPDTEWLIKQQCRILHSKIKSHEIEGVIKFIKDSTYIERSLFDSNPDLLNLQNGVLNLHTGEFKEHSPDHYFLSVIPYPYNPEAQCPTIVKFLHEALKTTDDYITAIELFGYSLYKTAKYEKAVLCVGDGDNGKGTFLKLFERFVGLENACHVSLQDLNNDKFAIANFFGKSVNTFADLPYEKIKYTGNFKMLTSGDMIRAQKKHGQPFYFANHALLVFSTNKIPQSDDDTYAYFKRFIMLPFERNFTGPDNDKNLIDKMAAELPGLLNLALIGLRKLIKDNEFAHIDDIETVEENYRKDDPIEAFIIDKCVLETGAYVICRDLYNQYLEYYKATHNGSTAGAVVPTVFGMELKRKGIGHKPRKINTAKENVYDGVKLKENVRLI